MKLITVCIIVVVTVGFSCALPATNTLTEIVPEIYHLGDYVEIQRNSYQSNEVSGRSSKIEENIEDVIKSYNVTFKVPIVDSAVTVNARNLDSDELDIKLNFNSNGQVEGRKSKLKKIIAPIFIFLLIKAMVMIPLALGILAIKTWNALQLSFVSFVIALGMGVWQLCKKVAGDSAPAHIVAHEPWSTQFSSRSTDEAAQKLAYSAYVEA